MARSCDGCHRLIEQPNDEYLELSARVLDATESDTQDPKEQIYADFCDKCIGSGVALTKLLEWVNWKLQGALGSSPAPPPEQT